MKTIKCNISIVLLLLIQSVIVAHPHMFVDVVVKYNTDITGIKNLEMVWVIDKMNSTQIIEAYDENNNCRFEKSELVNMLSAFKPNLLKMIKLSYDNTNTPITDVSNFSAVATPQKDLLLSFTIPYECTAEEETKELQTVVYDSEMYIAFTYQKERVLALHKNTHLSNSISFINIYDKEIISVAVTKDI